MHKHSEFPNQESSETIMNGLRQRVNEQFYRVGCGVFDKERETAINFYLFDNHGMLMAEYSINSSDFRLIKC